MKKQAEGKQKVHREGKAFKEWEAKKSDVIKKTEDSFFAVMGKQEENQPAESDKSGLEDDSYVDRKDRSAGLELQKEGSAEAQPEPKIEVVSPQVVEGGEQSAQDEGQPAGEAEHAEHAEGGAETKPAEEGGNKDESGNNEGQSA